MMMMIMVKMMMMMIVMMRHIALDNQLEISLFVPNDLKLSLVRCLCGRTY